MRIAARHILTTLSLWGPFLFYSTRAQATTPIDQKLFNSMTSFSFSGDREPLSGVVRNQKTETDIRTVIQTPAQKEVIVSVWSPRVHPFKEAPTYKTSRTCRFGEILESTIGVVDITKTHILRKTGRDLKVPHAFEWNDTTLKLTEISPPKKFPFKYESKGKVFEFIKTGSCQYFPTEMAPNEDPYRYFYKHIEIARLTHATDIIFPTTLFNFISQRKELVGVDYMFPIEDMRDLMIDLKGSTFLMPEQQGGFLFKNSQRISIKNLNLEWPHPDHDGSRASGPPVHGVYSPRANNSDLWFENLNLKRVPGWGFYFDSIHGASISNSSITQVVGDTVTAAREGAIRAINSHDIVILKNRFENLGSDGISLHGQMAVITSTPYLWKPSESSKAMLACVGMGSTWGPYSESEQIGFFDSKLDFLGEASVKRVHHFSIASKDTPSYCKGFSHCSEICYVPHPEFSARKDGFAVSLNKNSSLFLIRHNKLSVVSGKGLNIQGSNGEISDNIISDTGGPGIQLSADLANRLQGPGTFNILLRNNELRNVVTKKEYLSSTEPFFGGISIGASRTEADGRAVLVFAPLNQFITIDGFKSIVDQTGSVALQIASAKTVEVNQLLVGSAGLSRDLNSGSLSGSSAEGSVLLTRCQQIDLSGLSSPPTLDRKYARTRTIVIDSPHVTQIRIPISTRGRSGFSANTLWYTTFRGWFKDDLMKTPGEINLVLDSPGLSTFHKKPPLQAYSIMTPKVGDKESTTLGSTLPINATSNRWVSTGTLGWQSPNRIQLRPSFKAQYPNLFLSIDKATISPKKQSQLPFES